MKVVSYSLLFGIICALSSVQALGAISYTGSGIFEDFDSLPDSNISDFYNNDLDMNEFGFQRELPGSTGWEGTQLSGSTTNGMDLRAFGLAGNSSGTVGSAGEGTLVGSDNERAIAVLASGSWRPSMGVEIVNNSDSPLTMVSIDFTQELWRSPGDNSGGTEPGTVNTIAAEWSQTGAAGVTSSNFLSVETGFTAVTDLDLVSPAPANDTIDPINLDGNLLENQTARSATIVFSTPVAIGESFFLRFQDTNDPGRDATLAIDNFTLVPEPSSLMLVGLAICGLLCRTRSRK